MIRSLVLFLALTASCFAVDYYRGYDIPGYYGNSSPFYFQDHGYVPAKGYGYHHYRPCCTSHRKKKIYKVRVGTDRCCNPVYEHRVKYEYVDPCKRKGKRGFFKRLIRLDF